VDRGRWILIVCAVALVAAEGAADIQIQFAEQRIVASGFTPGARLFVYGVVNEPQTFHVRIRRQHAILVDDDNDGVVALEFGKEGVPPRSVWQFVELGTGARMAAGPSTRPLRQLEFRTEWLRGDGAGLLKRLEVPREAIDVVLVRPGAGIVAAGVFRQGTDTDDDRINDRKLGVRVGESKLIAGTGAITELEKGDIIVMIDSSTLEAGSLVVGR
jgi:hypothetical protein